MEKNAADIVSCLKTDKKDKKIPIRSIITEESSIYESCLVDTSKRWSDLLDLTMNIDIQNV